MNDAQERQNAVEHLRELIAEVPVALLTTTAADGSLHSRPMVNVNRNFGGELWFFTHAHDPKVVDIGRRPAVNVAFADPARECYVSVAGRASLVNDPKRIELLWVAECEPWFPEGRKDPHIALLRVEVDAAQYWDAQRGTMTGVRGFFKRILSGEGASPVENRSVAWQAARLPEV
jgi:general stress protein 26